MSTSVIFILCCEKELDYFHLLFFDAASRCQKMTIRNESCAALMNPFVVLLIAQTCHPRPELDRVILNIVARANDKGTFNNVIFAADC